jgi:hypothetical protein
MISAAILRLKELVGCPTVEASENLKQPLDKFLGAVPCNRMQFGLDNWVQTHLDNMYTYGRAHSEVILNNERNDIFGLVEVHPTTAGLRPTFGNYAVNVVQYQYGGGVPVTLIPELLLSSVNDIRGDDPNGTSLIAELPFVAQIANTMLRNTGFLWERFGTPTYHLNWQPPDSWEDPHSDQAQAILARMGAQLRESIRLRAEGRITDFETSGKTELSIMGASGEQLEFSDTWRAIAEQICAKFGLPPFMYGFSWASTERMSTAQSKLLTEIIETSRTVIEPQIKKLITLWQLVTGRGGRFSVVWPKTSLQDLLDTARADWMEAQSTQIKLANFDRMVRLGLHSLEEMAVEFRDDLDSVPLKEVRAYLDGEEGLPLLVDELPPFEAVPVGGDEPGTGGNQEPGAPPGGNNPRVESTRALATNGNGWH